MACVTLSAVRLVRQDFGDAEDARTNRRSALDIFYGLALAEALLLLMEKALWEWEMSHGRLLERVAGECHAPLLLRRLLAVCQREHIRRPPHGPRRWRRMLGKARRRTNPLARVLITSALVSRQI